MLREPQGLASCNIYRANRWEHWPLHALCRTVNSSSDYLPSLFPLGNYRVTGWLVGFSCVDAHISVGTSFDTSCGVHLSVGGGGLYESVVGSTLTSYPCFQALWV